jgi:uncharacterized damage-inducible protein DinB
MSSKELLYKYACYSQWAHKRLLDLILMLTPEQHHATIPSSFDSLYKTVFHIWGAESLWLGRIRQAPFTLGDPFNGSMQKLCSSLETVDGQWVDWFAQKDDDQLSEKIHYQNLAGQPFHQPYDLLLMHIFNHNTYHNGQLVSMLRALGIQKIPSTDFIAWSIQSEAQAGSR